MVVDENSGDSQNSAVSSTKLDFVSYNNCAI